MGVEVHILPPAHWVDSFEMSKTTILGIEAALEHANTPFEADLDRYMYPTVSMYDSSYHLCGEAVKDRTRKLIEDLVR